MPRKSFHVRPLLFAVGAACAAAVLVYLLAWREDSTRQHAVDPAAFASPVAIGWDGRDLWLVTPAGAGGSRAGGLLLRIEAASGAIAGRFPLEVDPVAATFDFTSGRVFIVALGLQQGTPTEGVRGQLLALDLKGKTLATAETGIHPIAVAVEPGTHRLLVLNRRGGTGPGAVGLYDADTLVSLGEAGTGTYPNSLELHAESRLAVVANGVGHSVSVVSFGGQLSLREISLGPQPGRTARAHFDPTGKAVVVTNLSERSREPGRDPGRVDLLDVQGGSVRWSAEFANPIDAFMTTSQDVVVVEEAGDGYSATVLDGASGTPRYTITGTGPEVIADQSGRLAIWRPAENRVVVLDVATGVELCQRSVSPGAEVRFALAEPAPVAIVTSSNRAVVWPIGAACEGE
jgi:hypothetical protein